MLSPTEREGQAASGTYRSGLFDILSERKALHIDVVRRVISYQLDDCFLALPGHQECELKPKRFKSASRAKKRVALKAKGSNNFRRHIQLICLRPSTPYALP